MNGDEKREIVDTFRYEFKQAFEPLANTVQRIGDQVVTQGQRISVNEANIENIDESVCTLSGRIWAIVIGVPALLTGMAGLVVYFLRS